MLEPTYILYETGLEWVNHSVGRFVDGMAHTNGIESFWSMLKRAYHHISSKHLQRYIDQFAGRYNIRNLDTIDMMKSTADGMVGKRITYKRLIS